MLRTFLSIPVPVTQGLRRIHREVELLGGPLRLERQSQWHLTVKFLGETEESQVPAIIERVAEVTATFGPFELQLRGVGVFPHERHPVVLWTGVFPDEPIGSLARGLDEAVVTLGFAAERRAFHPHLTLARINGRPPRDFAELLRKRATTEFGAVPVERVELMKSDLGPQGARHSVLEAFLLRG
ncbi:MAG: RNA 2',3'-cyclic phosphodiesterase [Planctomycetales bacterium]